MCVMIIIMLRPKMKIFRMLKLLKKGKWQKDVVLLAKRKWQSTEMKLRNEN